MAVDPISLAADELIFYPKDGHRKVKAAFWAVVADNPIHAPETLTAEQLVQITGESRAKKYLKEPGFREWLLNKDEFRQRLEYIAQLALDRLESILTDDDEHSSAQVAAAKLIMEAASKMPRKQQAEIVYADARIQEMPRKELEEYIRRNLHLLPEVARGPEGQGGTGA